MSSQETSGGRTNSGGTGGGWGAEPSSPSGSSGGSSPTTPAGSGGTYTDAQGRPISAEQAAAAGRIDQPGVSQFERIEGLSGGSGAVSGPAAQQAQPGQIQPEAPAGPATGPRLIPVRGCIQPDELKTKSRNSGPS